MTLRELFDLGCFEDAKWTCDVCQSPARWVTYKKISKLKSSGITFYGRCDRHKKTGDMSLSDCRAILKKKA